MALFNDGLAHGRVHKFGRNSDLDTATVPEDVWSEGGEYPWPTSASVTTIVSSSAADDANSGGGARALNIQGLDANYNLISETVLLSGITTGTCANNYIRVFRAKVTSAGTSGLNVGEIHVKHGATVIGHITTGIGQTLMAIYTIPADYSAGYMTQWYVSMNKANALADVVLQTRDFGTNAWNTKEFVGLQSTGNSMWSYKFGFDRYHGQKPGLAYSPKTDIRIRVQSVSANDIDVTGGWDMILEY